MILSFSINKKAFLPKTGLGHIEILNKDYDKARELFLLCIDEMGKTDFEEYEHIHKLSTVGEYKDLNKKDKLRYDAEQLSYMS